MPDKQRSIHGGLGGRWDYQDPSSLMERVKQAPLMNPVKGWISVLQ